MVKGKLILHYFLSFITACSVIFIINILFMRENIYNQGMPYDFEPTKYILEVEENIVQLPNDGVGLNEEGIMALDKYNSGIQILNASNREVFSYKKPELAPNFYSNVDLINLFSSNETTIFLEEKEVGEKTYTYIVFLDTQKVNRVIYTYDVSALRRAHHFPTLILINCILILILSFLFTMRIARPINRIIDKIVKLSKGDYSKSTINRGIYYKIEEKLNQLTERLTANEHERVKLEQMREEWISNITHDIKTPLTSIIGSAEILADTSYPVSDAMCQKYSHTILHKSQYIKTLVEDLNLSTRLQNQTIMLNKTKVNMVSLGRHVLIDLINDEKYNDHNITFKYSDEAIYLEVDEQLMKRVFMNLIVNAFIHNDEDVKVKLEIKEERGYVQVIIEDNGKGIAAEEQQEIFKRYYRGTHTRNKTEGSGLGLAIAHDIVKTHGGTIEVESEPGKGLKITITF